MTANDVMRQCVYDINGTSFLESEYQKYDELLTNVTSSMSNVYVNLIATLDLSYIHKAQQSTPYCKELHKYLREGACIDKPDVTDAELELLDHNIHVMNGMLH